MQAAYCAFGNTNSGSLAPTNGGVKGSEAEQFWRAWLFQGKKLWGKHQDMIKSSKPISLIQRIDGINHPEHNWNKGHFAKRTCSCRGGDEREEENRTPENDFVKFTARLKRPVKGEFVHQNQNNLFIL